MQKWRRDTILTNKYNIIWSLESKNELKYILYYFKFNLKETNIANKIYKKILDSIDILEYFPEGYPKLFFNNISYRKLFIYKYVIIYEVNTNTKEVFILHIFHNTQNYLNLL